MPDIDVQTLVEIDRIRRVIAQYGQLLDDHRFQEWGALFTEMRSLVDTRPAFGHWRR
jgi:hypothetical protein